MGKKSSQMQVLPPKKIVASPESSVERVLRNDKARALNEFRSLPDQVAKSSVFFKNWYPPELREKYNHLDRMKRIDRVYPYAKISDTGGTVMLLVDEPRTDYEIEVCAKKLPIMRSLGYKYCYIEGDMSVFDVLEQLGVV
jgi:hypothetical protein